MHVHAEKNFVSVNVANTCDEPLVQQDRFHDATVLPKDFSEFCKIDLKRIRAQCPLFQKRIDTFQQPNLAKLALIIERETMLVAENKEHSNMPWRMFVIFEILKRPGHAKVQSHPELAIGAHKQMFAMTATRFETTSLQSARELSSCDIFQNVRVPHLNVVDPLVQRRGVEVSLEYFNIR
jgi:hypothetical protein